VSTETFSSGTFWHQDILLAGMQNFGTFGYCDAYLPESFILREDVTPEMLHIFICTTIVRSKKLALNLQCLHKQMNPDRRR
jgi:hypothetical protein